MRKHFQYSYQQLSKRVHRLHLRPIGSNHIFEVYEVKPVQSQLQPIINKMRNRISATQMIRSTRDTSNTLLLKQRSSGIILENELREQMKLIQNKLNIINSKSQVSQKVLNYQVKKYMGILQQQSQLNNVVRTKIIQMLCIVILRLNYKMTIQALDILMYVGPILQKLPTQQYTLRQIVYNLVGKLSKQIRQSNHIKLNNEIRKRQKQSITLMIGNVLAYNAFRQRFEAKLRKSNLIQQKTFFQLLHENAETQIKLPQQIDPMLRNYNQITINIDKKSLTYSYEYPKILTNFIPINQYRLFISQINQIIVPQAQCHHLNSTMSIYYLEFLSMALSTSIFFAILIYFIASEKCDLLQQNIYLYYTILSIVIILASFSILYNTNQYKNPSIVYNSMKSKIDTLTEKYSGKGIFIKLEDSIQYFQIYVSKDQDESDSQQSSSEQQSSQSSSKNLTSNKMTTMRSIDKYLIQEEDHIVEHSVEDSDQSEEQQYSRQDFQEQQYKQCQSIKPQKVESLQNDEDFTYNIEYLN